MYVAYIMFHIYSVDADMHTSKVNLQKIICITVHFVELHVSAILFEVKK